MSEDRSDQHGSRALLWQPTSYPDVNAAVYDLLTSLQAILATQLIGAYLVGSLALGDFHPSDSDLDFVIITANTLSQETLAALMDLHQRFDQSGSVWSKRLDAVYIPLEVLWERFPHAVQNPNLYPILEWPGLLDLAPLENGWPIQRYTLREYGLVVCGPNPRTLLDPVNPDDLRQASAVVVEQWHRQAHDDREWSAWLSELANLTFVVLTLCRLLYTLESGSVASKPAAAQAAEHTLPSQWHRLIHQAITQRRATGAASEDMVTATLALLEYTYERYQQWQAS